MRSVSGRQEGDKRPMNAAIVVREAVSGDYEALCEIIDQVDELHRNKLPSRFKAAEGPVRSKAYIVNAISAAEIGLFVAETEHERSLLSFVHVMIRDTPGIPIFVPRRYAVVDSLAVRREHQRSGVGRALMERALAWAMAKGAESMELRVYAFNGPAMRFYERLGYRILSHHMTKWLDAPEGTRSDQ